jgi:hypothetical protein
VRREKNRFQILFTVAANSRWCRHRFCARLPRAASRCSHRAKHCVRLYDIAQYTRGTVDGWHKTAFLMYSSTVFTVHHYISIYSRTRLRRSLRDHLPPLSTLCGNWKKLKRMKYRVYFFIIERNLTGKTFVN